MKKENISQIVIAFVLGTMLLSGCGKVESKSTIAETTNTTVEETTEENSYASSTEEVKEATKSDSDKVASSDEMVTPDEVVSKDMIPVYGNQVKDGEYDIKVDSSSSMFNITECKLTVSDGNMTAVLTMSGKGYKYLFMGKGEEAVKADESDYINYEENDKGEYTFTVPVEALDKGIDCTAFSKKKEKWYDRVIVFRVDSLDTNALKEDSIVKPSDLALEDGEYTVEVLLAGGSGKTSLETPAKLIVQGDMVNAVIVFTSKNYDYVIFDDVKYMNENEGGNSTFTIPVTAFNVKLPLIGDTTAMSQPHEIEYTVYFDKDTIK
ncbi:MAG: hypothetical protein PUG10_11895 [Lachnospiraceae bacterium]|nr:hypothetical protein [Lachnospiraceae bacterium]